MSFGGQFFKQKVTKFFNYLIDIFFLTDIILNFRTSFINILTGDEITDSKSIAINYIGGRFWIDLVSSIPFEIVLPLFINEEISRKFSLLSMLKLFRVLRLSRIITYMNESDDVKLTLRLFKVCFFLLLYIHITACFWFYVTNIDKKWKPGNFSYYGKETDIFDPMTPFWTKFLSSFHTSILALTGNDIYPESEFT